MRSETVERGLVSTIIPVHNRAGLLRGAVESVIAQTYRPIEVVIVDDGSTDDTGGAIAELVREHAPFVRALRINNGGPGRAREAGRQVVRGEFIQHLDSDDLVLPHKFELQVRGLEARPECGASYGITRHYAVGSPPSPTPWKRTGERIESMFPAFLQSRWWETSTPLYRRDVLDGAGSWLPLRAEEDWEYDCRIASQGIRLHYCNEVVSDYRSHSGAQLSRDSAVNEKLRDRMIAHRAILNHARRANIPSDCSEMRHFSRELFLLSRQCGAAGLPEEARELFELARSADVAGGQGFDYRAYRIAAGTLGWVLAGKVACGLDNFRS